MKSSKMSQGRNASQKVGNHWTNGLNSEQQSSHGVRTVVFNLFLPRHIIATHYNPKTPI